MALNWKVVCDNIVNISQVLADFLDTVHSKDVEWVYIDDKGNVNNIKLPNLAKISNLFGKRYLGPLDKPPIKHPDNTPIEIGDIFYDTISSQMRVFNGKDWELVASYNSMSTVKFQGDGKTKEFKVTGGYSPNKGIVFLNGRLVSTGVSISDGNYIKFNNPPESGTEIVGYFFSGFEIATNKEVVVNKEVANSKTGCLIEDSITKKMYRLVIENGVLGIEEYNEASTSQPSNTNIENSGTISLSKITLIDKAKGTSYKLSVENGTLETIETTDNNLTKLNYIVLIDKDTNNHYELIVNNGVLELDQVNNNVESNVNDLTLVDTSTGKKYELIVEKGILKLEQI